ncbi:GNAT family N-acetyltransferase [Actinomadura macrotermitis]|uniref:N-acetyltransferase domain-containing protein n=1 Tax=Actinomadura macrotermitis TaxID=2585200 RepID=A0A7K0C1H2_9ACTN|nr:GNAT family N-acetyltransferase [Actinomadura macrotermitis]MQY07206.1 hypothetical protein [Actinomadura macrotermitis]
MVSSFRLRPAFAGDCGTVLRLISQASAWLQSIGSDQWQRPWPTRVQRDQRVWDALLRGETWMLCDGLAPIATVSATLKANEDLWGEPGDTAIYLHRLVVDRRYGGQGLGALLLNWVGECALHEHAAHCLRIDVWSKNTALQRYYHEQGFTRVHREIKIPDYPAGVLLERDIRAFRAVPSTPFLVEPSLGTVLSGRPVRQGGWLEEPVPQTPWAS